MIDIADGTRAGRSAVLGYVRLLSDKFGSVRFTADDQRDAFASERRDLERSDTPCSAGVRVICQRAYTWKRGNYRRYRYHRRFKGTPCRAIDISHKGRINYERDCDTTGGPGRITRKLSD